MKNNNNNNEQEEMRGKWKKMKENKGKTDLVEKKNKKISFGMKRGYIETLADIFINIKWCWKKWKIK